MSSRHRHDRKIVSSVEALESRRLLSTAVWTGAAGDGQFFDAANWQSGAVPAPGDDLLFNHLNSNQTVDFDQTGNGGVSVGSIYIGGNYTFTGDEIFLQGNVVATANTTATFENSIYDYAPSHYTVNDGATLSLSFVLVQNQYVGSPPYALTKYGDGTLIVSSEPDVENVDWTLLGDGTTVIASDNDGAIDQYGGTLNGNFGVAAGIDVHSGNVTVPYGQLIVSTGAFNMDGGTYTDTIGYTTASQSIAYTGVDLVNNPQLSLALDSGLNPIPGDTFTIIANQSGTPTLGNFAGLPEGSTFVQGGNRFSITYNGGTSGHDVAVTSLGAARIAPTYSISASSTIQSQAPTTITVDLDGNYGDAGGIVTFSDSSESGAPVLGTATLVDGVAHFTLPTLDAGSHSIVANYDGDSNYTSWWASLNINGVSNNTVVDETAGTDSDLTQPATVASTVTGPAITTLAMVAASSGKSALLSAIATDSTSALSGSLTYQWSVLRSPAGAKAVAFNVNDTHAASSTTATFTKAGTYEFSVKVIDSAGYSVNELENFVVQQKLGALHVESHPLTVARGHKLRISTTAIDQFGHVMTAEPAYKIVSGNGSIGTFDGLFRAASKKGIVHLDVTLDGLTDPIALKII